jgi:hypothetical protein
MPKEEILSTTAPEKKDFVHSYIINETICPGGDCPSEGSQKSADAGFESVCRQNRFSAANFFSIGEKKVDFYGKEYMKIAIMSQSK